MKFTIDFKTLLNFHSSALSFNIRHMLSDSSEPGLRFGRLVPTGRTKAKLIFSRVSTMSALIKLHFTLTQVRYNDSRITHFLQYNLGCTMPSSRSQTGSSTGNNCDVAATSNSGCGVKSSASNSYGPAFNSAGGGWYAVERTDSFIKVWFWSRNAGGIPSDVTSGATSVDTDNWGTPFAYFPNTSCDIDSHFGWHNIIINLTFCGDWAGAVYSSQGCPGSCDDYVNNNPSAFANAYFDFQWLKIYG